MLMATVQFPSAVHAKQCCRVSKQPMQTNRRTALVTPSIAIYPDHRTDQNQPPIRADRAMNEVRDKGKNYSRFFATQITSAVSQRAVPATSLPSCAIPRTASEARLEPVESFHDRQWHDGVAAGRTRPARREPCHLRFLHGLLLVHTALSTHRLYAGKQAAYIRSAKPHSDRLEPLKISSLDESLFANNRQRRVVHG
ncbi:hypothetical protein D9M69_525310 [compost metagenome]